MEPEETQALAVVVDNEQIEQTALDNPTSPLDQLLDNIALELSNYKPTVDKQRKISEKLLERLEKRADEAKSDADDTTLIFQLQQLSSITNSNISTILKHIDTFRRAKPETGINISNSTVLIKCESGKEEDIRKQLIENTPKHVVIESEKG